MMDAFHAVLEAVDPDKDCFRSYRIDAGTDLFGVWVVEVTYGRIGSTGRTVRYSVAGQDDARKLVRTTLRHRASAKKRIGVPYRFRTWNDANNWLDHKAVVPEANKPFLPIVSNLELEATNR